MIRIFAAVSMFLAVSSSLAQYQDQSPYERVLVPIMSTAAVPGAYGSSWVPFLTVRNDSEGAVHVSDLPFGVCVAECGRVPPNSTRLMGIYTINPNGGVFLYVGSPGRSTVSFSLRVQDVSRQSLTWGTTIPVVRERDVFSTALEILDVPIDERFRDALRIYDFDSNPDCGPGGCAPSAGLVRVRIYPSHDDTAVVDVHPPLISFGHVSMPPAYPAFAMIGDLVATYPQLAAVVDPTLPPGSSLPPRVRIVIEPASVGLRFWAFVTVTNNETQHVTALLPSQ